MEMFEDWPKEAAMEWIEMAWAAREAAEPAMNRTRRARFESVKQGLGGASTITGKAKEARCS